VRRIVIIAAIVLAALGTLAIRVVVEGRAALIDGDSAMAQSDPFAAVRAYEASARWYLPLAPHVNSAYERLRALTKSQQPGVALAAWRGIRSASRATRGLWTPHADDLAAADRAIAELSARDPEAGPVAPGADPAAREAWYRSRLARDNRPSHVVVAVLGIVLWVGGAFGLVRRGITASGGLARRPALISAATIVVGLVCWAVGLYTA
jgi:hypothetical protein